MEPKPESGLEFASPEPLPIEPIGLDEFLAIAKANPFHRGSRGGLPSRSRISRRKSRSSMTSSRP